MKNRRKFLQTSIYGLLSGAGLTFSKAILARNTAVAQGIVRQPLAGATYAQGIVRQPDEGETYFVREHTPITIKISKRTDGIDSASMCTEEIIPGGIIPVHKHLHTDELFYFSRGGGLFIIDDKEIPVTAGSSAFVPRGTWHGFRNNTSETAVFSFSYSPAGFEDYFRQIGTPKGTPFKAKLPEELKMIAERFGMVYK